MIDGVPRELGSQRILGRSRYCWRTIGEAKTEVTSSTTYMSVYREREDSNILAYLFI